jgi:hypothetical protein
MDRTFMSYMNLNLKDAWVLTKSLIDKTEKNNGVITMLWHNDHMSGELGAFYEKILAYCRERDGWMASGGEVFDWWAKGQSSVI